MKMRLKQEMGVVVVTANGSLFDGAIHALDLAIGPGMLGLGETVIDVILSAGEFEAMG